MSPNSAISGKVFVCLATNEGERKMKMKVNRYEIEIIPENEVDEVYIEEVLGLKGKGETCLCTRIPPMGMDHSIAYLEITKKRTEDDVSCGQ